MAHTLVIYSRDDRRAWFTERDALERLRQAGHSVAKATRIRRGAIQGDRFSIAWTLDAMGEL